MIREEDEEDEEEKEYKTYETNRNLLIQNKEQLELVANTSRLLLRMQLSRFWCTIVSSHLVSSVHNIYPDGISIWFGWTRATYMS